MLLGSMFANANPATNVPSDTRLIREITAVCGKHEVETGSPASLIWFMRALHENKHLAMDFWATVARLIREKSGRQTQPDWLLAAIVEGVTGQSLEEATASPGAQRLLVKKLGSMLAGQDLQVAAEDLPAATGHLAEPKTDDTRLEEAKEPELILPESKPPGSLLISPDEPAAVASQIAPVFLREEKPRLVLEPMPRFAAAQELHLREHASDLTGPSDWPTANDREIAIPLAAYAEANRGGSSRGKVALGVLVLALLAGGGLLLTRYRSNDELNRFGTSIRATYEAAITAWHGKPQAPPPPSAPIADEPAPMEAAPIQQPEPASNPAIGTSTAHEPVAPATRIKSRDSGDSLAAGDVAPRVEVAGAEMQDRLISSRVPVSSDPAHSDGRVVLQAVVTAAGTVKHLHFAGGDPALARAAVEAASTWRYQPYILDGTPVDVSTTITVDFSSDN
jgi:TonB family protein